MANSKREPAFAIALLLLAGGWAAGAAAAIGSPEPQASEQVAARLPIAEVSLGSAGVALRPLIPYDFGLLVVTGAEGTVARRPLATGESILFAPVDDFGSLLPDGTYRWELRLVTEPSEEVVRAAAEAREQGDRQAWAALEPQLEPLLRRSSGSFTLSGGLIGKDTKAEEDETPGRAGDTPNIVIENAAPTLDFIDTDLGQDSFRIEADASALSVVESDSATTIFTMEDGVVGLFTDAPDDAVELHIVDGLPEIRLDNSPFGVWDLRVALNDFQIVDSSSFLPETVLEVAKMGSVYELNFMGGGTFEGDFAAGSSRELKRDIEAAPGAELLERLRGLPLYSWSYITDPDGVRHLGPIAEEFHETFGLGRDDKHISPTDTAGLALAAIQALADQLETRDREIVELRRRLEALEVTSRPGPPMP